MRGSVSHDRAEETLQAKARWFRSLTLEERMDYLVMMTDLILQNNPSALAKAAKDDAASPQKRIRVVERP
ncbi:hypothetical protein [Meiothermus ruber]|uniref:Uncharacterized protein n=1 Tax=Meiothermus ruber (strain ATCC 35948 / DSM 1279 / VKM B-1258 / 21) TaxID=504728 RepID=M9X6J0_MEIRD|nr:hypothetical protein [Meiothermus ruber]AGK04892.1 hypothetical protein K649_07985 [Meiothermus ruber DSM 1279]MCL6530595.1 hypothetical protein [Meiothermus ruber]GAO76569.1 putative ABC transporter substrate binding protein [Meiothermus ruber H328]